MFLGEFAHTIDTKGRLTIPAKFRGLVATGLVVTRGFDQNLMLYPMEEWEALAARIAQRPLADTDMRSFRRRVFSGAVDLVPDRQGRVIIPPYLREFAGIDKDVVIAGMFNYLEVWNSESWTAVRDSIEADTTSWADLGI
jgi:MraZ protein